MSIFLTIGLAGGILIGVLGCQAEEGEDESVTGSETVTNSAIPGVGNGAFFTAIDSTGPKIVPAAAS